MLHTTAAHTTAAHGHGMSSSTIIALVALCISAGTFALNYWRGRPAVVVSIEGSVNFNIGNATARDYRITAYNRSATPITIVDVGLVTNAEGYGPVSVTRLPTHAHDATDPTASLAGPWRLQGYDSHTWVIDHEAIRTWPVPLIAGYATRPPAARWWRRRKMKDGKTRSDWRQPHQINS